MSARDGSTEFVWGDGELHKFQLVTADWEVLQTELGRGPFVLFRQVREAAMLLVPSMWKHLTADAGNIHAGDCAAILRVALISAGMDSRKARALVRAYVEQKPLADSIEATLKVLEAAVVGPADEPGKSEAAKEAEASASPKAA